ncbi:MAG TPA: enolase C-terminal domain-like protein [Actinomycetes bacterium]
MGDAGGLRTWRVRVPLAVPFQGVREREATLVEGPAGWGEVSPFPGFPTDPALAWQAAREAATTPWPAPLRAEVEVAEVLPAVAPDRAAALALRVAAGTVKVKVGRGDDLGRVRAVREVLGPRARIRVDANGAWDVATAVDRVRALAAFDVELVEQPVAGLEDLARVRRLVAVPLAADEAVRGLDDARRLRRLGAADALVVKVQAAGGVRAALALAEAAGVPAIPSSLVETSVGLAAGLAFAACLPATPFASGLGTGALLAGDVVRDRLVPVGGRLAVRRPVPDPELLARYQAVPA